jgi:LuxR family maltose regulon positive regulatory protein
VLNRKRLFEVLDLMDRPVTVVVAPSGFGKTTLVRSWVESVGDTAPRIWVTLSGDITTRHAFWSSVVSSALRQGHLSESDASILLEDIEAHDDPVPIIAATTNSRGRVVLILDAYESLRETVRIVDDDLLRLTERAPELRVILTTRTATGLAEESQQLRGKVRLITERELAFTREETATFLGEHLPGADPRVADLIHRDTRGYPLAIRATTVALSRQPESPIHSSSSWRSLVVDDLAIQLASSNDVREFVLYTSVPPFFDPDLAADLSGRADVKELLGELEWNGFGRWIPYSRAHPVFQYADSVRDTFLAELRTTDPGTYSVHAARSAEWMHANGKHEEALVLAIDAGDYELATRIYRSLLVDEPESYITDRLERHLSRIPLAAMKSLPVLAFGRAIAQMSNPATRASAIELLQVTAARATANLRGLTQAEILVHYTIKAASLRFLGSFVESARVADRAIELFETSDLGARPLPAELQPLVLRHLAYSLFQNAQIPQSRRVVDLAVSTATRPWSRNYTLVYGVGIHAITGRRVEAEATLEQIDPDAWPRDHEHTYLSAMGRIGKAALLLDDFDFDGALRQFDGCESFLHTAEFWPFFTWTFMHAHLGLGGTAAEAHRVDAALRSTPSPPGVGRNLGTAALHNALTILWLASGRRARATELLAARVGAPGQLAPAIMLERLMADDPAGALRRLLLLETETGHTTRSTAGMLMLGAAAAIRVSDEPLARTLLDRATAITDGHRIGMHLLYLPSDDADNIRALAQHVGDTSTSAALQRAPSVIGHSRSLTPTLTPREREVLRALGRYETRREQGEALHVSAETIKTHTTNIYRKLGVDSRDAAIQRALELELLGEMRDQE